VSRRPRGRPGKFGVRVRAVLPACIGVALVLGVVGASASPAPSYLPMTSYLVGSIPNSVAIGDLNGDGKLDLATANHGDDSASVLLNKGDGRFQASVGYGIGHAPSAIAIGDLNDDGKPELVAANYSASTVSVLVNRATAASQRSWTTRPGALPRRSSSATSPAIANLTS
jgi:FG-GAP-like repeat